MSLLLLFNFSQPRSISLTGQINCNSNRIIPITKLSSIAVPSASFQAQTTAVLTRITVFGAISLTGQINCNSNTFLPYTKVGLAAIPVAAFERAATGILVIIPATIIQNLAGTIICQLRFAYSPLAPPNDSSSLIVSRTLQGSIADLLLFSYASGATPNDTSPLSIAHTVEGTIITQQIFSFNFLNLAITGQGNIAGVSGFDSSSLTVNHTLQGTIICACSCSGSNNLTEPAQSSCACLAVLSAQLAVAHSLQGSIDCNLVMVDSFFRVAHTLVGNIVTSLGMDSSLNIPSGGSISGSGSLTGDLGVSHTLQGTITTVLNLQGVFFIQLTGQINCNSNTIKPITRLRAIIPRAGFLPATQGTLTVLPHHLQGQINCVNTIIGSCNVTHTLSGSIVGVTGFSGDFASGALVAGSGIIIGSLGVSHTLQSVVVTTSQFVCNNNVSHPLDNGGITLTSNIVVSDLLVNHNLIGRIYLEGSLASIPVAGECIITGILSLAKVISPSTIVCTSNIIVSDLLVNHSLISSIITIESGSGNLTTGNNASLIAICTITGFLNRAVALQGSIVDSFTFDGATNLQKPGSVVISAGCVLTGQLTVAHSLKSNIVCNSVWQGTIQAGAPTTTFPGDFIVIPFKDNWLFAPKRIQNATKLIVLRLIAPVRVTLFANLHRIIRLFVPNKPKKS